MKILFSDWLIQNDACEDAIYFVQNDCNNDVRKALENCPDPYWLAWLEERIDWLVRDAADEEPLDGSYAEWGTGFVSGVLAVLDAAWYTDAEFNPRNPEARKQAVGLYYMHVTPMDEIQRNIVDQGVLVRPVKRKAVVKKVAKKAKKTARKGR
jgi:hypothetical protein